MEELKYQRIVNGAWEDVDISKIKDGDIFRGIKSNGQTIKNRLGGERFIASEDAYIDKEQGSWVVCIR